MIDFEIPGEVVALRDQVNDFIQTTVIPAESRDRSTHGLDPTLRRELQEAARAAGVFAPHIAPELGGLGLDHRGCAVVFEAAGYSLLGPQALNCAAPDEGNMHLLSKVATQDQQQKYLAPLAAGTIRSCFAMTEPPPGAGSDPDMLDTIAEPAGDDWVINGRKWFITGADGAAFAICMARTSEQIDGGKGATMFLVDAANPGWRVERLMDMPDRSFAGGHAEITFSDCRVPATAVLGEVGLGYQYAQVRLGPARLTHCMRWLGVARRALDIALDHALNRRAFGQQLGDLGMVQQLIADSVIDLETSRAVIWRAAWALDVGSPARHETSVAKAHVAETVGRIVDRSVQVAGGQGVSGESPLGRFLTEVRPFRIYDGPTETHRWSIARRELRQRAAAKTDAR